MGQNSTKILTLKSTCNLRKSKGVPLLLHVCYCHYFFLFLFPFFSFLFSKAICQVGAMIENKQVVTTEFSDHLKQPGQKAISK